MSGKSFEETVGLRPSTTLAAPAAAPPAVELVDTYRPWGAEHPDADDVIELRLRGGEWHQLFRSYLVRIEGSREEAISLLGTGCVAVITGRHLGELRRLLRARKADFIEEFDPGRWPAPPDGAPLVERIEVITGGRGE